MARTTGQPGTGTPCRSRAGSGRHLRPKLDGPGCLLRAEKKPDDCYRKLVDDRLAERGWDIVHLA